MEAVEGRELHSSPELIYFWKQNTGYLEGGNWNLPFPAYFKREAGEPVMRNKSFSEGGSGVRLPLPFFFYRKDLTSYLRFDEINIP